MITISKSKLKAKMLSIFREIEQTGEEIIVTDNKRPVLKISPIRSGKTVEEAFGSYRGKVKYHEDINAPSEFLSLVERCERVHITTDEENHKAKMAKGDYEAAGIHLLDWSTIDPAVQETLWAKKLKGKVNNASDYAPKTPPNKSSKRHAVTGAVS